MNHRIWFDNWCMLIACKSFGLQHLPMWIVTNVDVV